MSESKLTVVVGGFYGSEGKGATAAHVASHSSNQSRPVVAVRVAGPNAGHIAYGRCPSGCDEHAGDVGHPWKLRQVPIPAVSNDTATLVIAAGSEIDPGVLAEEVSQLDSAGYNVSDRLVIDQSATLLERYHIDAEAQQDLPGRLGSTGKGIGEARVARLRRVARTWANYLDNSATDPKLVNIRIDDTAPLLNRTIADTDSHVVIEGTQGYGLGLHTKFYPKCTSSDCRAIDFMAMAGVNPWLTRTDDPERFEVLVVLRTYPIRVAGNSGDIQGETTWEDLGIEPERTTVTNKVRRVGAWDPQLAAQAVAANGGGPLGSNCVRVSLTMADYRIPDLYGMTHLPQSDSHAGIELIRLVDRVYADVGSDIALVGTSPSTMIDLRKGGQQ